MDASVGAYTELRRHSRDDSYSYSMALLVMLLLITFRVRHSLGEMYIGHGRMCVCVCLSLAAFPHCCTDPDVTCGNGRGCRLVVHHWADLQLVGLHGFRCYDSVRICKLIALYTANAYSAEREMSAIACTHSVWLVL